MRNSATRRHDGTEGLVQKAAAEVKRVLILSTTTGYQLRAFDTAAERLGVELVFATDRCHQLDDPWRDRAIAVRFHHEEESLDAILAEAARGRFDGILVVGDRPAVLAAHAANALGLPGNPPHAAAASGNKRETRTRLAAAGLAIPWHFTLPLQYDARKAASDPRVTYPCVLKPLGLSGSRGVIRADSPEQFVTAFERIRALLGRVDVRAARTGLEDVLLVEGFIRGREVAVEGVLTAGELRVFAIFDKPDPLDGPFFEETIYLTPSSLSAPTQVTLCTAIQFAADALGLRHGAVHAECRLGPDGIFVLEIAARPIGGLCSRALRFGGKRRAGANGGGLNTETAEKTEKSSVSSVGSVFDPSPLSPFAGGISLEEVLLRHAIGEDVSNWTQDEDGAAVMMIPIPKRGLLKRLEGEADARRVEYVEDIRITAKPDQLLEPLPEAGSYLGFIFTRAPHAWQAEAAVREAHRRLTFVIDPAIDLVAG